MNIYEKRFNNAIRIAEKINEYIDNGYLVIDEDGAIIKNKFTITDEEVSYEFADNARVIYFDNDKNFDNGSLTKISDYNKKFENWKFVHPKNIERLIFN